MAWLVNYPECMHIFYVGHSPPVLIRVNDRPQDPIHQEYLLTVLRTIGEIEYRKLRQDWLAYQNCSIDVIAFCKRTKLLFRGDRLVHKSVTPDQIQYFRMFKKIDILVLSDSGYCSGR